MNNGRRQKSSEVLVRKTYFGVNRKILMKVQEKRRAIERLHLLREYLNNPEQNFEINISEKGLCDKESAGIKEYITGKMEEKPFFHFAMVPPIPFIMFVLK